MGTTVVKYHKEMSHVLILKTKNSYLPKLERGLEQHISENVVMITSSF